MDQSGKSPPAKNSSSAWDAESLKAPHAAADKRHRVQRMFAAIAPSYDLNNRLHSLWMDQAWRRRAVKLAELKPIDQVVDVACGTGDLTFCFAQKLQALRQPDTIQRSQVCGVDFTFEMLPIAQIKARAWAWPTEIANGPNRINPARLNDAVFFINGDAQHLPLANQSADVISIAFGIRNVQEPSKAIAEFYRVLRPGGRLIILEFSLPTNAILRSLYNFYFHRVLPRTATLISGDTTGAYKYLPHSVNTFIGPEQMMTMLREAGFEKVKQFPMTFGVCICYRGVKP